MATPVPSISDTIRQSLSFNPVRTLSALLALGGSVITAVALFYGWAGDITAVVGGAWANLVALVGTFFTAEKVVSNPNVEAQVHSTIVALAPLADAAGAGEPEPVPINPAPAPLGDPLINPPPA